MAKIVRKVTKKGVGEEIKVKEVVINEGNYVQNDKLPLTEADLEVLEQEQSPKKQTENSDNGKREDRWVSWADANEKKPAENPWQNFDVEQFRGNGSELEFITPGEVNGRKIYQVQSRGIDVNRVRASVGKVVSDGMVKDKAGKGNSISRQEANTKSLDKGEERIYRPMVSFRCKAIVPWRTQEEYTLYALELPSVMCTLLY
ncbi:OLC1v1001503C1 [Oldenlandia corymbosa var. corymbosa]|uniref:OLC1v1001503C1 n=1 Tax=Oldenlandia corymbosa var. corymbosa TaxID=529605 RepID=A0AAV1D701_OLDCO|nr:OLC1v1001503C1 [Oldenlandia corymbosa var. corymbosa]